VCVFVLFLLCLDGGAVFLGVDGVVLCWFFFFVVFGGFVMYRSCFSTFFFRRPVW